MFLGIQDPSIPVFCGSGHGQRSVAEPGPTPSPWSINTPTKVIVPLFLSIVNTITINLNTPGTAGGPGGRDQKLAVKGRKNVKKTDFFRKKIKIT